VFDRRQTSLSGKQLHSRFSQGKINQVAPHPAKPLPLICWLKNEEKKKLAHKLICVLGEFERCERILLGGKQS